MNNFENLTFMPYMDDDDDAIDMNGFAFQGGGYYDEEGIWHDPEVEGDE